MEEAATKKYELRNLQSKDVFGMVRVIKKIGVSEFKKCFNAETLKSLTSNESDVEVIGMAMFLDIADVIICNADNAENEIYKFLSNISGMEIEEIASLDMTTFIEMIMDVFKKEEFKDFIGVASRLLK